MRKEQYPGKKILIWKRDLKSCFRQFMLCPGSVHLVGYKVNKQYWYDLVLAMGSSSSAHICQRITNLTRYVFENRYEDEVRNFLDDFFSAQMENMAWDSYNNLSKLLEQMGIEENLEKACPPTSEATVLGVLFNTILMTLSLTEDKTKDLTNELSSWAEPQNLHTQAITIPSR